MLKRTFRSIVLCCLVAVTAHAARPTAVPIEQESSHHVILQNERVRVFEVLLPPGEASLWHVHRHDGSSVRLTQATIDDEPPDGPARTFHLQPGAVSYGATPAATTHRVRNTGTTPFHNIYIELLANRGQDSSVAAGPASVDPRVVQENERIRALRRVLMPGEIAAMHTHALSAVAVIVTHGRLEVTNAAGASKINDVKPGAVQWVEAGTTHALKNVGDVPIEIVDIELK